MSSSEFKQIVRLVGVDLPGDKAIVYSLRLIKGIGINMAYAICRKIGINPHTKLGSLSEAQLKELDAILREPHKLGFPPWFLNRPKDPRTGKHLHLITSDLIFTVKGDIDFLKEIRCWRGIRHMFGLKVRGQRTRTTGRTGITVGVKRRKK
ncbi:MAG: 30S ribosomal protein S13 [Thermofilum sp. ex4484_82]|nr:30S ribosomal protein S13 [Thermoproteales archaeon]OYT28843.1 MAG: 30S ribosomal protein S13 [Thermofilum sp. ex4484_82]OYT38859.1 MAG: 30S ribosomal protein S13 [Archaeoglobales archaeon ex4484_92]RLE75023.1 MAG: 30S ribosomal protein S13 [Thermoprotei archaeon]RLE78076.1 MAG: 30S ribosomal protein S13 [Thermoprotei archaeon]